MNVSVLFTAPKLAKFGDVIYIAKALDEILKAYIVNQ